MNGDNLQLTPNDAAALAFFGQTAGNVLLNEDEVNAWVAKLDGDVLDAVLVLLQRTPETSVSERALRMARTAKEWARVHGRPASANEHIRPQQ